MQDNPGNEGIVLNPIGTGEGTDLSNDQRHPSNASEHNEKYTDTPFTIPLEEKAMGFFSWHFAQSVGPITHVLLVIAALFVVGAKQSVSTLLDLGRLTQDGIQFFNCEGGICQTLGTPAATCSNKMGYCSLPLDNNAMRCTVPPNVTNPTFGGPAPCFTGDATIQCCCDGTKAGIQGMFLDTKTGACLPFASTKRTLSLLSQYFFSALFPAVVAGVILQSLKRRLYKQDLFYRLIQHGFLLDFKDRDISCSMVLRLQCLGWKYSPLFAIPLGMAFYIYYGVKKGQVNNESQLDVFENTVVHQLAWISLTIMYYTTW
jgi:hypothetical protein